MNNAMFMSGLFGGSGSSVFIIAIIAILGVTMIIPMIKNKKQEKKEAQMRDELQPGDEVTTIGGIIGRVVSVKGETFVLETTKDKTKIRFLKGAIRSVDVKAQDLAAQIIDSKAHAATKENTEKNTKPAAPAKEKTEKKKRGKKYREAAENTESTENAIGTENAESTENK